ncbi:Ig-like domain-containing protein [Gryllotalpicola ginsengisoli]|uniref:Ig-like domain-containing protein n=1 Tax=Gryllotalpicola ginsengisoli TaxID=444608 RepID=UPI0012DE6156|nr:Ig-like domain-containing protein [Gryllotalpicola ginsengisoli]
MQIGRGVLTWLRRRKSVASAVAIAVLAGVPLTVAALHKGFPVSDVDLKSLDVWVTNGTDLLAGRLNHQIDQLDASVAGPSKDLDVLQDGSAYFLTDTAEGSVQRIDPAYVSTSEQITVPEDSWVGYGGDTMAILAPDGRLWTIDAADRLDFDATKTKPVAKLGKNAAAVVTKSGVTYAVSPQHSTLVRVAAPGRKAETTKGFAVTDDAELSSVGDTAVVLDNGGRRLRTPDKTLKLPSAGLQLQQPSTASDHVLVSAASALYRVPLSGDDATTLPAGGNTPDATNAAEVSAPVQLKGCDYAAWASSARYLYACEGSKPVGVDIGQPVSGADLRFRVNHGVIALNNVQNGDAWVVSSHMKLVRNWEQLKPSTDEKKKSDKGQEQPVVQSYQDTLAHRSQTNTRPKPEDDEFGVRPGRTTLLPVLDNDEDPDGDVLTVKSFDAIPKSVGTIAVVDGGRALQFTPAPSVTGGAAFKYTVTDGRPGGEATAEVRIRVHEPAENAAPKQTRLSTTEVEQNESITYNVLQDWIDPDGDSIYLESATKTTADQVSFTPDGEITFTNKSGQVGTKQVNFVVSDGTKRATGKLEVTVKQKDTLPQVAVPDFAQVTLGQKTTIKPLENDESPSGAPLTLVSATSKDTSLTVTAHTDQGTISVLGQATGTYYFTYELGSGARKTVDGLVRIDVVEPTDKNAPPLAVNDVVYVHPSQTSTVDPLDNDVSPSGRVLAVQSVTGGTDASALNIQLLDNTEVRVTSPGVLEKQVQLTYELSDGLHTVQGTITVVPVAPLVNYQPPVAVNDAVNVRAGDISTVDVLDNDYSPDDQPFTLDPTLKSTKGAKGATVFVSGSSVRFQAPSKPGIYTVTYSVSDQHNQSATADVIFNVIGDSDSDRAPEPQELTARAFAGSAIPISIPLNGIDPDGDSVFFDGVSSKPELGRITGTSATGFVYQPADSSAGTEELTYQVEDTHGKTATGQIRIGVIPRPSSLQPPTAVNDKVEVKPGKTGSVQVLANDSDPNGYSLTLEKKLDDIDEGLTDVSTDGSSVLFTAPKKEGAYLIHYTVSNGHGGTASAYVQVIVSSTAQPRYPTAVDHYVDTAKAKGKASVTLDALDGATNPSGPVSDLTVAVTGQNAKLATVKGDEITIKTQKTRTVVAYQVTDPQTKLTGKAFIIVPPASVKQTTPTSNANKRASDTKGTQPPHLKSGLAEQVIEMNGSKTFSLSQLIDVPSGRPASLAGGLSVDHGTITGSGTSFTVTPAKDYRGALTVRFNVDDGKEPGASSDRITPITLPVTVGAKDQSDVPPTFTPPKVQIEPGEAAKDVDLRSASDHPNPQIKAELKYEDLQSSTVNGVKGKLSGSTLSVSAPVDTKPGTTAVFKFKVVPPKGDPIDGSVTVTVTSSTRPLAQQKNPPQKRELQRGNSVTLSDAVGTDYWVNPFPDTPLKITDATLASAPAGVSVSHTDDSITVTAQSGAKVGTVNVNYHVEDATEDPDRTKQVVGQFQVTIHDRPDQPQAPSDVSAGDASATMTIAAPAANGKDITQYEIRDTGKTVDVTQSQAGRVELDNLTNGHDYAFQVRAKNADGWSEWSTASATVTPYGKPATPKNLSIVERNNVAPSKYDLSWSAVTDTGGKSVHYEWQFDDGAWNSTTKTTAVSPSAEAGTHYFRVRAINDAGKVSDIAKSGTVTLPKPQVSVTLKKGGSAASEPGCTSNTCYYYSITVANYVKGTYPIVLYCNGSVLSTAHSMTIGSDGSGSWNSKNDGHAFCGYSDTHATVNKIDSNHVDFSN